MDGEVDVIASTKNIENQEKVKISQCHREMLNVDCGI